MGKPEPDALFGRTIAGKFVVEDPIGSGAMGAVYRARHIALEKTIAIKVLHGEHASDPAFAMRFHREAKAASRLNHPNSIQIIDFGQEPDGLLYIAMEYLDGRSLHRLLREEAPLPPERVADILMQALAAVAVAHEMGVVHRDLKPENIVVLRGTDDDGRARDVVKVLDFGIAKITDSRAYRSGPEHDSAAPVTTAGFLVGTPEYMSPEQGKGEKLDPRSDLYSMGVVLYEMLARRLPFEAENAIGVILHHITELPTPPSAHAPFVDARLEAICLRAMRKAREERYQSAREMRTDLRAVIEGRAIVPSGPALPGGPTTMAASFAAVGGPVAAAQSGPADEVGLKPTLTGTAASTVPRAPHRRMAMIATVVGVTCVAAAVSFVVVGRLHARRAGAVLPSASATLVSPITPIGADLPSLQSDVPQSKGTTGGPGPHSTIAGHPGHVPSAKASASVAPSVSQAPSVPTGAPSSLSVLAPNVGASAPSSVALAPAATGSTVAAPDPNFDPDKGVVDVGLIVAQGIGQELVRKAIRGAGLTGCYRQALRAQGSSASGTAKLDLSIDETGATHSAILTGASFLPGVGRCIQGAASSLTFAAGSVQAGGASAEINLSFRSP